MVALAETFGVQPLTYSTGGEGSYSLSNQEELELLRDETLSTIAHKSLHLPPRDRQMILNIIRQFEGMQEANDGHDDTRKTRRLLIKVRRA
jgi:hypothetical protein